MWTPDLMVIDMFANHIWGINLLEKDERKSNFISKYQVQVSMVCHV